MNPAPARLWRWLLWAYPPDFRFEYGSELVQALDARYREQEGLRRLRFCLNASTDVISTALKERYLIMKQDFKLSLRRLRSHPMAAAVAILSLSLGIGANTTMFSILHAAIWKPLPYPESDRRVMLFSTALNSGNKRMRNGGASPSDFIDWRNSSKALEQWHLFAPSGAFTATGSGTPERVVTQAVTPGLLESLGAKPILGRFFRPGEEAEFPAVISERYWERRYGRQPDVLGRTFSIEGEPRTIIGVAPKDFELLSSAPVDIWGTIDLSAGSQWIQRRIPWLSAAAKLKPGVTIQQAQAEMDGIAANLERSYPDSNRNRGVLIMSMVEARNGTLGSVMYPLFGAVLFVLLIACANVANLLIARASARHREISVRAAMGASRGRLIREFLADGLVLALPGVAAGLGLAYGGVALFRAVAPPGYPGAASAEINGQALAFTAAVALAAGLLSAIFPALTASRVDVTESLKEGARGSTSRKRERVRSLLVAGEIALALVLLVGAGLMIGSILRLQQHTLGFDTDNVTIAQLELTGPRYKNYAPKQEMDMRIVEPAVSQFLSYLVREVRNLPGVEYAAMAGSIPVGPGGSPGVAVRIPGRADAERNIRRVEFNSISADFFRSLRIPLRKGRFISDDDTENAAWVTVVNEAFAREFFPKGDAVGQVLQFTTAPGERPRQIVGVVADFTQYTPRAPVFPEVYASYLQQPNVVPGNYQGQRYRPKLIVRTRPGFTVSAETLGKIVAEFDKDLPVYDVKPLAWHVANRNATMGFYTNALGLFSLIALILATIGIYGLMSYSVTDRFHEIGIRRSLGATRPNIVWLIISQCLKLSAVGLAAGVAAALAASRVLESFLFGVKSWDPVTFGSVIAVVLAVAVIASTLPALRATTIDAAVALRRE